MHFFNGSVKCLARLQKLKLGPLKGFNNFFSIMCDSNSCCYWWFGGGGGQQWLILCFDLHFRNAMLISIHFILLPGNRKAMVRIVPPLARGGFGCLFVEIVWGQPSSKVVTSQRKIFICRKTRSNTKEQCIKH